MGLLWVQGQRGWLGRWGGGMADLSPPFSLSASPVPLFILSALSIEISSKEGKTEVINDTMET